MDGVVVPAEIRKALNVQDGEARLTTRLARLQRSQEIIQRCARPSPNSVVDELIAERRAESEGE